MAQPEYNRALHRFAMVTAIATLGLVGAGGLVTSKGAGLAVPDWPTSWGYNMFFLPLDIWKTGGVLHEHTHRLWASGVGLLTTMLAVWFYGRNARPLLRWGGAILLAVAAIAWIVTPDRFGWRDAVVVGATGLCAFAGSFVWPTCDRAPKWLRVLGWIAFIGVVLQGVLGGLRVTLLQDELGVVHATLGQMFFVLLCAIALFTSRRWREMSESGRQKPPLPDPLLPPSSGRGEDTPASVGQLRWLFVATTLLIFFQLILGAMMRHQHAGLAIPDFPLAYGKLWPATDAESIARYNLYRPEVVNMHPITAFQIYLQMAHRIVALFIVAAVAFVTWKVLTLTSRSERDRAARIYKRLTVGWLTLIVAQVALGIFTIWSEKAADIATLHVVFGALSLATGAMLCIVSTRNPQPARAIVLSNDSIHAQNKGPFAANTAAAES